METKNEFFSSALKTGLIIGVVSIFAWIIMYIADIKPVGIMIPMLTGLGMIAISIVILVILFKKYKASIGGFISFKDAFLYCFIALSVSVVLSTLITYLFIALIEPDYYKNIMEAQKTWMENYLSGKMSEEQVAEALDKIDAQAAEAGSVKSTLKQMLYSIIGSGVIALIAGAIMKKKPEMFDNASGGVI